jgi:hypothetical protein
MTFQQACESAKRRAMREGDFCFVVHDSDLGWCAAWPEEMQTFFLGLQVHTVYNCLGHQE